MTEEKSTESAKDERRVCPFSIQTRLNTNLTEVKLCLGKNCACYVRAWKPLMLTNIVADPENIMVFEGCGLLATPCWEITRKPKEVYRP